MLDKDEIDAAAGDRAHVIEVEHFVCVGRDRPGVLREVLLPRRAARRREDAYRLLHDALEQTGRAALGRFTFHNREYLAAIRPLDGVLALHTLRFADELVAGDESTSTRRSRAPASARSTMAAQLVESLHEEFRPERYEDEYREAVLDLIQRKAAGKEIEPPRTRRPSDAATTSWPRSQASLDGGGR